MKKTKSIFSMTLASLILIFLMVQTGCKEDNPEPTGTSDFKVSLKSSFSSRASYDSINIDIQKVSIHSSTDTSLSSGWVELETNVGVYNLIDYTSGNDTIMAIDSLLEVQTVSQIRLVLGNNNTIVDNGVSYELETPSAQTSGLKIQVNAELQPNTAYKVVLNFDPDASIIKTGNNKYKLKPVIDADVVVQ